MSPVRAFAFGDKMSAPPEQHGVERVLTPERIEQFMAERPERCHRASRGGSTREMRLLLRRAGAGLSVLGLWRCPRGLRLGDGLLVSLRK